MENIKEPTDSAPENQVPDDQNQTVDSPEADRQSEETNFNRTDLETDKEQEQELEAQTELDAAQDSDPDSGLETQADPESGLDSKPEPEPEPEPEPTTASVLANTPVASATAQAPVAAVTGGNEVHLAHKHKKMILIVAGVITVLLVAASAVTIMLSQKKVGQTNFGSEQIMLEYDTVEPTKQDDQKDAKKEVIATELAQFISPTTGETWLPTAKPMDAQGWLKVELLSQYTPYSNGSGGAVSAEEQLAQSMPQYREVGKRGSSKIIFVYTAPDMGQELLLFEQAADGKVSLIAEPQTTGTYATEYRTEAQYIDGLNEYVTSKVSAIDTTTHYESLSVPETIPLENGEVVLRPEYLGLNSARYDPNNAGVSGVKVRELGGSTLYRTEKSYADTKLTNIGYALMTPLGTEIGMRYEPNTISLEKYTFDNGRIAQYKDNGKIVTDSIVPIARGCGGTAAAVTRADALKKTDLVAVGKTDTGRTVYMLKDDNGALNKKAYEEYKTGWPENPNQVTFAEFLADHAIMIIENKAGELLVYTRGRYSLVGGCAKPVVYLYPTEASSVSVSVGANVTVSDPSYGTKGWQGVWAEPSGRLTYAGQTYDSLFWEGQGLGDYPGITSGTIVRHADVAKTMRAQLFAQGLNSKETADFMAFWEPKIPKKSYVRLTWLTTRQIDSLAPLNVWPKPTTTIRVFLDMDGYDKPFTLPAQKLSKTERRGFTVVEWGGLTAEGLR